jgi:hypothetical protein
MSVETCSTTWFWFKKKLVVNMFCGLSVRGLFKLDQPVIFGVVYIPPEYTKYSSDEAFNEIQQE